jgi:hypothetical protein
MRRQSICRALLALTLGAVATTCACVATAQYGAMQSGGATGPTATRPTAANSSAPGRADMRQARSQWTAGSTGFGKTEANAWSTRNEVTSSAGMWSPGHGGFGYGAQAGGVWTAKAPGLPSEATPGTELGTAPTETQTAIGLPAPVGSTLMSGSMTSSGPSVNKVAMHGTHTTGSLSASHAREHSMYATQRRSTSALVYRSGRAGHGSAFRRTAGQTQTANGNSYGLMGTASRLGLVSSESSGPENGQQLKKKEKSGFGLEDESGPEHDQLGSHPLGGHSE